MPCVSGSELTNRRDSNVNTFSISASASQEIRRILRQADCREPIAELYEYTCLGQTFNDLNASFLKGELPVAEMEALVTERLAKLRPRPPSALRLTVKERAELPPEIPAEYLCRIGEVTFLMFHHLAEMLQGYRLVFEEGEFFFRGPDDTRHVFSSVDRAFQARDPG